MKRNSTTDAHRAAEPQPKSSGTGVPPVSSWFRQGLASRNHTGGTLLPLRRGTKGQRPRQICSTSWERFPRNDSRVEPLNRNRRRESALILCLESKQMRRLTSAATRSGSWGGLRRGAISGRSLSFFSRLLSPALSSIGWRRGSGCGPSRVRFIGVYLCLSV